ncbi:MAG: rod shape-determining protein RodA [Armatimonadetes bacterium]|nr:rod shape-determining protein RodA [Armatimonadota bacterium]
MSHVYRLQTKKAAGDSNLAPGFDLSLLLIAGVLVIVGFMAIYSSTVAKHGTEIFRKQVLFTIVGMVPAAIVWRMNSNLWMRASLGLYILNLVTLLAVLMVGDSAKGAQRWIDIGPMQFQPSEMSKFLTIITLSTLYAKRAEFHDKWWMPGLGFLYIAPSLFLIKQQPHLSSVLTLSVIWLAVTFAAGFPFRNILLTLVALGVSVGLLVSVGALGLRGYQESRIKAMTQKDVKDSNYQQHQAAMAYGVGGLFGTGYLKGEQKQHVPEQHNDFIFSVIGEEGGLVACSLVLAALAFLFFRIWLIMAQGVQPFTRMAAAGVLAVLGFHTFVNLGMNLEILPVSGLWLPFLSYGGTAMWLCMACVSLAQSLYREEQETIFN